METLANENKDVQYAYRSLHDFFDQYHLPAAVKETEKTITAAAHHKAWVSQEPYRSVYFMEQLNGLIETAYTLVKNYSVRTYCIVQQTAEGEPDLAETQNFIGSYRACTAWGDIPRYLTAAQYHNPYIAIKKFTKHATIAEWKETCKDLAEYALTNASIDERYCCYELLHIRLHILRLIEASHLLDIRYKRTIKAQAIKKQPVKTIKAKIK